MKLTSSQLDLYLFIYQEANKPMFKIKMNILCYGV